MVSLNISPPLVSPKFTKKPEDAKVNVGESFKLSVEFSGNPEPALSWSFDGKVIENATEKEFIIKSATEDRSKKNSKFLKMLNFE